MKRYGPGDTLPKQAQQMWLVLTSIAVLKPQNKTAKWRQEGGLVSYGETAELMGKQKLAARTLTRQLGIIGKYCEENELPALNSIVVNIQFGVPGRTSCCR